MAMEKEMISHAVIGGFRRYAFECPACGEKGNIGLDPKERGQFACPAECGASFIEYQDGTSCKIRCVVLPVFRRQGGAA